ncbi:MAG: AhpC/TSA family protein [Silicimonas sp.]|nr:AhpC/TSA family protein [Silicimonas sp.]NND22593.1 AhpC/TSA family protein [Silicimonas sp.]NND42835.1 AhpC/TSA family protein [Silicimonas sp.]
MSTKPMPGNPAPALSLPLAGGGTFDLSAQSPGAATMVIFYRGLHCPVCETYLTKVKEKAAAFADAGMPIVLVSMDGQERAEKAKADWGLADIPVAYSLSEQQAREWGLYISTTIKEAEPQTFSEPGSFWVLPDGTLYLIDIASMPFARPDLDILLSKVGAIGAGYPPRGTTA